MGDHNMAKNQKETELVYWLLKVIMRMIWICITLLFLSGFLLLLLLLLLLLVVVVVLVLVFNKHLFYLVFCFVYLVDVSRERRSSRRSLLPACQTSDKQQRKTVRISLFIYVCFWVVIDCQ